MLAYRERGPRPRPRLGAARGFAEPAGSASRWSLRPYVLIARPDHWCKNGFMVLGVLLAGFYHPTLVGEVRFLHVLWALAATCLLASSNYVLNEILDAPTDRHHPRKRNRPIPAGQVWLPLAYVQWLALGAAGLGMAADVNRPFLFSGLALLVMGVVYNVPPLRSKDWPYLDALSEAVNNPLRLLLGWFAVTAADFPPLSLLLAYWMVGAFFMTAKRFAEYRSLPDRRTAGAYRSSFRACAEQQLLLAMFFYAVSFGLFLGIFTVRYHVELILIHPLVAGFLCCYLRVALKPDSAAQAPERLYREKGLMAYLALCVLIFVALVFIRIPACYHWFKVQPSRVSPLWRLGDDRPANRPPGSRSR